MSNGREVSLPAQRVRRGTEQNNYRGYHFQKGGDGGSKMKKLLLGTMLLALAIVVPIPTMAAIVRAPGHHDHADHSIMITRIGHHDQPDR
jgi:hypothetical protein